jgi:hypothetical protein
VDFFSLKEDVDSKRKETNPIALKPHGKLIN